LFDSALQDGFMDMVTTALARLAIGIEAGRGKHPLPGPFAAGVLVLLAERARERNVIRTVAEGELVLGIDSLDVVGEVGVNRFGEEGDSVFASFARSDDDMASVEVDVLDSKICAFEKA
jgi:hypothetical protein